VHEVRGAGLGRSRQQALEQRALTRLGLDVQERSSARALLARALHRRIPELDGQRLVSLTLIWMRCVPTA
jgi:hypothetical protein